MPVRVSLHGMLRLIRVDTLRRFHNVVFFAGRLIFCCSNDTWFGIVYEGRGKLISREIDL